MLKRSVKTWIAIDLFLVVLALLAWMGWSRSPLEIEEAPSAPIAEPAPIAEAAPEPPAPTLDAAAPSAPAAAAVDLFAGETPDWMIGLHARVLGKQLLDVTDQKRLYDFGKANPKDARPQLLLAWDSMHREWDGIAVRMYRIAYRADARAKDDPSMLRDLLDVASRFDRAEYREVTALIQEAYGQEALPRLDAALKSSRAMGNPKPAERLEKLRAVLVGAP